jgi:hypothetical protein
MRLMLAILVALGGVAGCAKAQANAPATPPGLATPRPPDRVIVPAPLPEPLPPEPQEPQGPPASAAEPASTPQSRPSRPASVSPVPVPAAPETAEPIAAPPVLQTATDPVAVERRARALIASAERDLGQIDPTRLSANARAQYDTARAFVRQANSALQVKNVTLARELADKAASLATQLRR